MQLHTTQHLSGDDVQTPFVLANIDFHNLRLTSSGHVCVAWPGCAITQVSGLMLWLFLKHVCVCVALFLMMESECVVWRNESVSVFAGYLCMFWHHLVW